MTATQATIESLVPTTDLLGLDRQTHLYTAAEGPMLRCVAEAVEAYLQHKSLADEGRLHAAEVTDSARNQIARLLGAHVHDIAFMASSSDGINTVAGTIDWQTGDNVVINDLEFPSVVLPWMNLRSRGVEVRVVRHRNWDITTDDLLGAVDDRTRLLGLSHVSYVNGLRHDIETIGNALRGTSTRFLVDATQSLGVLPVEARSADFVVSSTYKWLLGTHGVGILYWNRERLPDVESPAIGWYSVEGLFRPDRFERYELRSGAGRFEKGYLNFPGIFALNASTAFLQDIDSAALQHHVHDLGDRLISGLDVLGLDVTSPRDRARRGASVTILHDHAEAIGAALADQEIHVWAGDGRIRASTHAFNSSGDVDRYLETLESTVISWS